MIMSDHISVPRPSFIQRLTYIVLLILLMAGVFYVGVDDEDEGAQVVSQIQFAQGTFVPYSPGSLQSGYAPLSYYIQGYAMLLVGPSLFVSRAVSAIMAAFGVFLAMRLVQRVAGYWASIVLLLLLLATPQTLRIYSTGFGYGLTSAYLVAALWAVCSIQRPRLRVFVALLCAGTTVLIRHSLIATPIVFLLYFALTEKPGDWVPAALGAALIGAGAVIPFWPYIAAIANSIPFMGRFLPWSPPPELLFANFGGRSTLSIDNLYDLHIAVSTHQAVFILCGLGLVLYVVSRWNRFSSRESFSEAHIAIIACVVFAANMLVNWLSSVFLACAGCFNHYLDYFVISLMIGIVIYLFRLASGMSADETQFHSQIVPLLKNILTQPVRLQYTVGVLAVAAILTTNGGRAISAWRYKVPSPLVEVNRISTELSGMTRAGDYIFYLGPWHPLIALPDRRIFPELDYYYVNYLRPDLDLSRTDMAWLCLFDDELLNEWLTEDADIAVITDLGMARLARHPTAIATINAALEEDYHLVRTMVVSQKLGQVIRFYERNAEPAGQ